MFVPTKRWEIGGWEITVDRAFPPKWWWPHLTRVSTGWKRGWGYRGGLLWQGGDLRWLTLYATWRKSK